MLVLIVAEKSLLKLEMFLAVSFAGHLPCLKLNSHGLELETWRSYTSLAETSATGDLPAFVRTRWSWAEELHL